MEAVAAWAASGAMALTGRASGPALGPSTPLVDVVAAWDLGADALARLGERAAVAGLRRNGTTSCGGGCRLLRAADGWVAVTLARDEDVELIPAWLGARPAADPWSTIATSVAGRASAEVVERGALLGLPVARLGEVTADDGCIASLVGDAPPANIVDLVVVDLSALWAGPLCGSLLADFGAQVVKVESVERPDGARNGPAAFFDLLNGRKLHRSVALEELPAAIAMADVVIESSRPRALRNLGVDPSDVLRRGRPRVWVSITGHGRTSNRVAFGDDAAVAGGLVAWEQGEPRFCADAVADPLTGMRAARAVLDALAAGGRWLLDVALSRVAASMSGPTLPVDPSIEPIPPRLRS